MFSLFNWFVNLLYEYGFYQKSGNLLFLGIDDSGKTTLLHLLKTNKLIQPDPSMHPSVEEMTLGRIKFTTYDLGGHVQVRKVWKEYMPIVDGIVFMIDSNMRARFNEVKAELDALLDDEYIQHCPIVVLGNKIDKFNAASEEEILNFFNLKSKVTGKVWNFNLID